MLQIKQVETEDDIRRVRELILEFSDWVRREVDKVDDLSSLASFSDFEAEMQSLPGIYGPPDGRLLLATNDTQLAGCGALKKIGEGACELKRMYVRPAFRGKSVGKKLLAALIGDARQLGYKAIYLETHVDLKTAQSLYASFGFKLTELYFTASDAYLAVSVCMKLDLDS